MTEPTNEQIQEWKQKHGDLHKITSRESGKFTIIRKPSVREMDAALSAGSNGGLGFSKVIHNQCALFTSPGTNDDDLLAFYAKITDVVNLKDADLEKL